MQLSLFPSAELNMPASFKNSAVATGLEKSVFIPIPKKDNTKECLNYCTITLISHASKIMLKIIVSSHVIVILLVHELRICKCTSWI